MIIKWFEKNNNGEKLLCATDGELPLVGHEVYLNDLNKKPMRTKYRVIAAYHSLNIPGLFKTCDREGQVILESDS